MDIKFQRPEIKFQRPEIQFQRLGIEFRQIEFLKFNAGVRKLDCARKLNSGVRKIKLQSEIKLRPEIEFRRPRSNFQRLEMNI